MEITGGSCEHSDLLGFESPLCFVWIGAAQGKGKLAKTLLRNRVTTKT